MSGRGEELEASILAAIRRIVHAIHLHSRQLVRESGLTGPQLVTLRDVARLGPVSVSALARAVELSQPTVTGILVRLEREGLVRRERSTADRRNVVCTITPEGARRLGAAPPLLQDRFRRELGRLVEWEQTQMLATLQRLAAMMDAEEIPAAPLLVEEIAPGHEESERHAEPRGDGPRPRKEAER